MKTMKCYDCDLEMQADDRNGMLQEFYTHYMNKHQLVITGADASEKKEWMKQFDVDFARL